MNIGVLDDPISIAVPDDEGRRLIHDTYSKKQSDNCAFRTTHVQSHEQDARHYGEHDISKGIDHLDADLGRILIDATDVDRRSHCPNHGSALR